MKILLMALVVAGMVGPVMPIQSASGLIVDSRPLAPASGQILREGNAKDIGRERRAESAESKEEPLEADCGTPSYCGMGTPGGEKGDETLHHAPAPYDPMAQDPKPH